MKSIRRYIFVKDSFLKLLFFSNVMLICLFLINDFSYAENNYPINSNEKDDNKTEISEENIEIDTIEDTYYLDDINVVETVGAGADSGITEINRDIIRSIPSGNQGITDILKVAPGVQFDEQYRGAGSAGEVKPAEISISGGNVYDNLFLIDGMSNSSLLDPGGSGNTNHYNDVKGDPQKFFISQWLIEDITLLDSDVTANYDGFQGGVVDVRVRKPSKTLKGNFSYRGTNNYLTKYFVSLFEKEELQHYGSQKNQLMFEKHFVSASIDIPITDKGGLLVSFNRNWSTIPLRSFKEWENQERHTESYYAKGIWNINSYSYLELSSSYSPNYGKYYLSDVLDSEYKVFGGGAFGNINYVNEISGHKYTAHLDINYSENSKLANNEYKPWLITDSKRWGEISAKPGEKNPRSIEGGYGSISKYEYGLKASFDHNVKPIEAGGTHKISYGAVYNLSVGRYFRGYDAYRYDKPEKFENECLQDFSACVSNEQYFKERYVTPASDETVYINNFGLYLEEDYQIERFNFRVGLRGSYDDYLNNFNLSPRARLKIDLFNNKKTLLTAGYGRYYAASMLTYKLREARSPSYYEERSEVNKLLTPWSRSNRNVLTEYKFSDLKTPYNDEYTVSLNQDVLGSFINLKYLYRDGRDGIASQRDFDEANNKIHYSFNNNGKSRYQSVQLKWQKSWKNHTIMANFTFSDSYTSNNSYDESLSAEEMEDFVYYNGKPTKKYELPKGNYARPIIVNATYVGNFFKHLKVSLTLNYKSPYKALMEMEEKRIIRDEETNESKSVSVYEDVTYENSITLDLGLYWEQQIWKTHKLTLFCEVYNLFNTQNEMGKRVVTQYSASDYELGTQIWFGVNYEF